MADEAGARVWSDCWNKIGVGGDASCAELKQHIHCRNCPTYTAAALRLLDRDLPSEHIAEWTAHFTRARKPNAQVARSAIVFRIGSEWLALSVPVLDEVAEPRPIHSLPHLHNGFVLGLVNVRGQLLTCISLAKLLRLEEASAPAEVKGFDKRRFLVVRQKDGRIAFPVDEVLSIHRYHPSELKSVPATIAKASRAYTQAILPLPGKTVGCLDDQLLSRALDTSVA